MQARRDAHDTARNWPPAVPTGLGVAWIRQLVPFHAPASVSGPPRLSKLPAAVQARAAVQDTAVKPLPSDRAGLGEAWIRQTLPFHRSASVRPFLAFPAELPTAVQARTEVHDTARNSLEVAPAGRGVAWRRHRPPVQRSASSTLRPCAVS